MGERRNLRVMPDDTPREDFESPEQDLPFRPARKERGPVDRTQWARPWAQLKFVSFQPAIFPRMLGDVSRDAKPGDLVSVYDKFGERVGIGLFNPRAKMPLRVVTHTVEPLGEEYFETAIRRAVALRRDVFKLDAEVLSNHLSSRQDCHVLQHCLAAVAEAGGLHRAALQ